MANDQNQRNNGLVDFINSQVNNLQNARLASFLAKRAASAALAFMPAWGFIALIGGFLLIVFILVLSGLPVGSGTSGSSGTNLSGTPIPVPSGATPPPGGTSSNQCTKPYEGTGYCSFDNLKGYFGNDPTKALTASLICQAESGSDPNALDDNCSTNDYSVGLFQINLVAHCVGAYANLSCRNLIDINKRNSCEQTWRFNPIENLNYASLLSGSGSDWTQWGTWANAGKSPPVRDILTKCGINH